MSKKIDTDLLSDQLLGKWGGIRQQVREELSSDLYSSTPSAHFSKQRKQTLKNIKLISENKFSKAGFPFLLGGSNSPGGGLAVFEEVIFLDASTQIKYGVQFGLFASAIMHLGTDYHHKNFLPSVVSLKIPGCFAMTETGHGSDVASLETTATFDPSTDELIINTPSKKAWKDYIGNAAKDGKAAVVFAQLIVKGENHGVHAIYVPIRNSFGLLLKGVSAKDDGYKGGLNGIDNGRLAFNNVRVPRVNLLNRYGNIDSSGNYSSPIESKGRRFFTMLGTLIQGRVSLVGAVTNAEKLALLIAVRYAHERKQFGTSNGDEQRIIDYPLHQSRLYPRLASLYAQIGMHQSLVDVFDEVFSNPEIDPEVISKLETDAAAAKALSTWNALETIQMAREACGGQGFLSENRLVELRKDLDVYATFEGDNNVLLQLVAKRLLSDYASNMKHPSFQALTEYASYKVVEGLQVGNLLGLFKDFVSSISIKNKDLVLNNADSLVSKYVYLLTEDIANSFNSAKKKGASTEEAFLVNQPQIVNLGKAYAKHLQVEGINKLIRESDAPLHKEVLTILKEILILEELKANALGYLKFGLLGINQLDKLTEHEMKLFATISEYDLDLVESFAIPEKLVRAKIAQGSEYKRNSL